MSWWRSVVDKTTRLQYDTAWIGYTEHQYPRCQLKIQRKHSIQNRVVLPEKSFLEIKSVHNTTSQDEIGQ